ncbi:glutaredoxin domain-containing protein [Vibrio phage vB_VcorM_GR28A]|nr:glutaredoxin domain-containing protein [Vibrio phage vB_VcorM_GR28A]
MITIMSKDGCPYCERAIKISEIRGVNHLVLKLGSDFSREEMIAKAPKGHETFPLILDHKDQPIGGFKEYSEWLVNGGK